MARPARHKGLTFKCERRDIGRAVQKKITKELRFKLESDKGPSLSEMIFRTSTYTTKHVRTVSGIRIAGSLRRRRALLAHAPFTWVVIKDKSNPVAAPALPTGNRKTKYRKKHKIDIRDIDYLAVMKNAPQLSEEVVNLWQQTFKAHCDCGASQRGISFAGLQCQLCGENLWVSMDSRFLSENVFSFRGVIDSIISKDPEAAERNWKDRHLPVHLRLQALSMPQRLEVMQQLDTGIKDGSIKYGYGVKPHLIFTQMPQPHEDEIVVTQKQFDTIESMNKRLAEDDKRPLLITRGHYGDLQAAAAYPGCQKIFDNLTKNGVEFIEQDDPRAQICDYSVCFMYPHVIKPLNLSPEKTQKELGTLMSTPLTPGEKVRFNSELPHHAPAETPLHSPASHKQLQDAIKAAEQISPVLRERLYSTKHLDTNPKKEGEQDE
jgi:hypothetical protein